MLKIIELLLATVICASTSCLYSALGTAATFSEIPLDAVAIQTEEAQRLQIP